MSKNKTKEFEQSSEEVKKKNTPSLYGGREFVQQFSATREAMEKLVAYKELLFKWQKTINLIGSGTIPDAWERHFADSAQLLKLMPTKKEGILKVVDLGSGGGFPGAVIAMMCSECEVHLIESDERKAEFLRSVSRETDTPMTVHNGRVEDILPDLEPDVITARALASLKDLLEYSLPCAKKNMNLQMLFLKGKQAMEECDQAVSRFDFHVSNYPSETNTGSCILRITGLSLPTVS